MRELAVGSVLGKRYRVERLIGRGGMGEVYVATDLELRRKVAVKVAYEALGQNAEAVKRFRNEAVAAARIRNPHIITVLDVGHADGLHYMVQELLEGCDLSDLIAEEGPLAVGRVVRLMAQACVALDAVHKAGLVHRDIKPSNLFVTRVGENEERLILLDFGIAKIGGAFDADVSVTQTGQIFGTPLYMAPEQFEDSSRADAKSDVYSLGAALYQALTGEPPFSAETIPQLVRAVMASTPRPPSELRAVPPELDAVVLRCLAKRPEERFSAAQLRFALLGLQEDSEVQPWGLPPVSAGMRTPSAPFAAPAARSGTARSMSPWDASMVVLPRRRRPRRLRVTGLALSGAALVAIAVGAYFAPQLLRTAPLQSVLVWLRSVSRLNVAMGLSLGLVLLSSVGALIGWLRDELKRREASSVPPGTVSTDPDLGEDRVSDSSVGAAPPAEPSRVAPHDALPLGADKFAEFLASAGLRETKRVGNVLVLERSNGSSLANLAYAGLVLDVVEEPTERTTVATVFFQARAGALYELRGEPRRPLYVITVLRSLPGAGVYKAWHDLAIQRHVRVLPVTPRSIDQAMRGGSAPKLVANLIRRAQSDAFSHVGPVINDLEFFGWIQVERLAGKLLQGVSFALSGLDKWGTTSLLLRVRGEFAERLTVWVDLAALPELTARELMRAVTQQLEAGSLNGGGAGDHRRSAESIGQAERNAGLTSTELSDFARAVERCRKARGAEPPVLFIDRGDELLRLAEGNGAELDRCLRLLYSWAFPTPGSAQVLLALAGNDDRLLMQRAFAVDGREINNPLWYKLDQEYVQFFEPEELSDFFGRLGPYSGLELTDTGLIESFRKTGGHKYLCRELGSDLVRVTRSGGAGDRIGSREVAALAPNIAARHARYFEAVFDRAPRHAQRALERLVSGPLSMLEFLGIGHEQTSGNVGALPALQFAINFSLVSEHEGRYALRIGLLGEWLALHTRRAFGRAPPPDPTTASVLDDAATPQHPAPDKPNAGLDTILGIPRPPVDGAVPRPVPSGSGTIIACRVPSNEESRKLREIVLRVCSAEDLQIIAHDLGMPLERIVSPQVGFELQALRLIEWSMNHERVEDLKSLISARSPSAFRAG